MDVVFVDAQFFDELQRQELAAEAVRFLVGLNTLMLAMFGLGGMWALLKLQQLRNGQKVTHAKLDQPKKPHQRRATDEQPVAGREVRDVRAKSVGGHELSPDVLPQRGRDDSPAKLRGDATLHGDVDGEAEPMREVF